MPVSDVKPAINRDGMEKNAHRTPYLDVSDEFEEGTIEERRRKWRGDSSISIPEIDVTPFVDYILPPLRKGIHVQEVVSSLREEGLINSEGKWRHFGTSPAQRVEEEDAIFAPLSDICERVTFHASRDANLEPTFVLDLVPNATLRPPRASTTRPDGYFILKEAEDRARNAALKTDKLRWWYDIAFTLECKKGMGVEDLDDNVSKLVFNMQQSMTLDASRRFSFGITIENTQMRLWFCSRATVVVSKAFDFTANVELLTEILIRFTFASKEELGWDLTIRPFIRSDGTNQYEIDVDDETYVTEQVLSDSVADALISRATRVWRARSRRSGDVVVLKDVWVEDNRLLEHEIYGMILRDVEEKFGEGARKEVASHLLTPVAHWLVPVNGEEDHTRKVMMHGYTPLLEHRFKIKLKRRECRSDDTDEEDTELDGASTASGRPIIQELGAPFPQRLSRRRRYRRKHYRIVFKEVASSLYAVERLSSAFLVLRDAAKALKWIHGSGWVHRDLSAGNLFFYHGRGLIGDLEYAKCRNSDTARELRIGTLDFMSVEANLRSYIYIADTEESDNDEVARKNPPPFFHNDLHDLESLWWTAVWKLFFYRDFSAEEVAEDHDDERRRTALYELFPGTDAISERMFFLEDRRVFFDKLSWVPEDLCAIRKSLNSLRSSLHRKYWSFESHFSVVNVDVFDEVHEKLCKEFETARNCAVDIEHSSIVPSAQQMVPRNSDIPLSSLEQDADDKPPEASPSTLETEPRAIISVKELTGVMKCLLRGLSLTDDDFLTPLPFVCVAKYAVETC